MLTRYLTIAKDASQAGLWTVTLSSPFRTSITATFPLLSANWSGVQPSSSLASRTAPASTREATSRRFPDSAAQCSAVLPRLSTASSRAPTSTKTSTASALPSLEARGNGTSPSNSASTSTLDLTRASNLLVFPRRTAFCSSL